MNWNRVLNVFIAVFLLLNLGIFGFRYMESRKSHSLSPEREAQLKAVLQERKGIMIYDHLPDFYPKSRLELQPPVLDQGQKEKIRNHLVGGQARFSIAPGNGERYAGEEGDVVFSSGTDAGRILFQGRPSAYAVQGTGREGMAKAAQQFAGDLYPGKVGMVLTQQRMEGDTVVFLFNERYKGELLFCNQVEVRIDGSGRWEVEAIRYPPLEFRPPAWEVVPVDEALYQFMLHLEPREGDLVKITDIDLGYDLDPGTGSGAVVLEAMPYYRIRTADHGEHRIHGFTNKLQP
ncbi:hypothetical protein [Anaerotalea alkaliphila]|uniref:Regulatory protein YycH-like domain-containing protein n=1 Tax=Anaerotalea alkaliphila TaxID=2662126 RepID=A0A7X5KN48_9FIRM|nr:hypothetical protein [Anaerotalea alkaliphila]NDL66422.1 hypothetical protein [Anaerotalea alkaliphila]